MSWQTSQRSKRTCNYVKHY